MIIVKTYGEKNSSMKWRQKCGKKADFFITKTHNVLLNIPVYVGRMVFNNDVQQMAFSSAEKWLIKIVPKQNLHQAKQNK